MSRHKVLETVPDAPSVEHRAPEAIPVARAHHHSSLGRALQVAEVLARQELWYLVEALDLGRLVPRHAGHAGHPRDAPAHEQPVRLRLALAELGPTFMKLGQMLALRPDLLPPAYQIELAKLQDAAPTLPLAAVRETVAAELGQPPERAFAIFEPTPLAAASIGQAHRATLRDGTQVVVKVRRPGAAEQIDEDLKLLHSLAAAASRRWTAARQYDLVGLAEEFDRALRAELDYLREGRNAERFARNFAGDGTVHIPGVRWETTTARVLTLERVVGCKVTDGAGLDAAGVERAALADRGARLVLKMVFEDGFFHADLHPGNLFVEGGGRLGLIDFGLVGTVDARTRATLARLLLAVARQDAEGVVDAFLELDAAQQPVDRAAMGREITPLLARLQEQPAAEIAVGPLLTDLFGVVLRHQLVLPADLALLVKPLAMAESLGEQLDPAFGSLAVLAP